MVAKFEMVERSEIAYYMCSHYGHYQCDIDIEERNPLSDIYRDDSGVM